MGKAKTTAKPKRKSAMQQVRDDIDAVTARQGESEYRIRKDIQAGNDRALQMLDGLQNLAQGREESEERIKAFITASRNKDDDDTFAESENSIAGVEVRLRQEIREARTASANRQVFAMQELRWLRDALKRVECGVDKSAEMRLADGTHAATCTSPPKPPPDKFTVGTILLSHHRNEALIVKRAGDLVHVQKLDSPSSFYWASITDTIEKCKWTVLGHIERTWCGRTKRVYDGKPA